MTTINYRSTVVAIKAESTEGTPVAPAAVTDYIPIEDDFTMEPSIEKLENAELKNSLGKAKGIVGSEAPTASFSLYLKHSGIEGQAPNWGSTILKALFGTETVDATEEVTDAASTTAIVKLTANGSEHPRGSAVLVKDSTNGYAIRPVHSVATNDLTLGFELGAAPGAGVSVGKAVTYSPANSGHQTLTVWQYAGNGGATAMMSGGRVVSGDLTFEAGQLINGSYSMEGLEYFFNPIQITSSTNKLDFTDDDGTFAVSVAADFYKDPHELASAVQTAMNASGTTETHACIYSDTTGKFTISTSISAVLSLLWKTGASGSDNTDEHIGTKLGYTDTADDTGSTSYIADTAQSFVSPYSPSFDSADPLAAKANQLWIGDADDNVCVNASSFSISVGTPKANMPSICATSGVSGSVISERTVTASVTAILNQYDADKFRRFRENTETRIAYIFGEKSGGNWVPGKCGCIYIPTATISSLTPIEDQEGLVGFTAEFETFVDDSGNGEVYISFV